MSHNLLAFPAWLIWLAARSAFQLSAILVLCLIIMTGDKWGDTPTPGRLIRAGILLGLLA